MRSVAATGAAVTALGAATLTAAHLESRFPLVRRFDVPIPKRPGLQGMTVLHISDLHMWRDQKFIVDFLAKVAREEDFDFVVSTGDNLSDDTGVEVLLQALRPLTEWPGAFVLGSNDYYKPRPKPWTAYLNPRHHEHAGERASTKTPDLPWFDVVQQLIDAGWLDLTNQSATVEVPPLTSLIGVDDPHILRDRMPVPQPSWDDPSALRLALAHAPYQRTLDAFTDLGADLILCGHTHGGQIRLPGVGALVNNSDIPVQYSRGLYPWEFAGRRSWLNISAGMGTSRYARVRLFCRPEVSLLRLVPVGD